MYPKRLNTNYEEKYVMKYIYIYILHSVKYLFVNTDFM